MKISSEVHKILLKKENQFDIEMFKIELFFIPTPLNSTPLLICMRHKFKQLLHVLLSKRKKKVKQI